MVSSYDEKVKQKHSSQINNEENNPCFKEHNMSLNCLNVNNYDNEACQPHFENYRNCRAFWDAVRKYRRINGIYPLLPPLHERADIKAKFMATGTIG